MALGAMNSTSRPNSVELQWPILLSLATIDQILSSPGKKSRDSLWFLYIL